ncbi:MAG: hypothetical protein NZT92_00760 [Abditibacteriales bacterium]|nr:hypothetical protein [Abditibacteriales bacterium]MDW8364614.1 hypothetical protein [Abditibacteriales bacterium]
MIVIERRRKRRHRRRHRVWWGLIIGAIAATVSVLAIPVVMKGWRLAEDWQKRKDLEQQALQNPQDAHALHALGLKLAAMEDSPESLLYLEKALEIAPINLIFGNDYRLQCAQFKEHERAVRFLRKLAHEKYPHLFEPRVLLALAYVDCTLHVPAGELQKKRWWEGAVEELSHVIQRDAAESDGERRQRHAEIVWMALYLRGLLYLHAPQRLSHTSRAIEDFRRCVARQRKAPEPSKPYFVLPLIAWGDALVKSGQLSAAQRVWEAAGRQFASSKELQQRLGLDDASLAAFVKATRAPDKVEVNLSVLWKKGES